MCKPTEANAERLGSPSPARPNWNRTRCYWAEKAWVGAKAKSHFSLYASMLCFPWQKFHHMQIPSLPTQKMDCSSSPCIPPFFFFFCNMLWSLGSWDSILIGHQNLLKCSRFWKFWSGQRVSPPGPHHPLSLVPHTNRWVPLYPNRDNPNSRIILKSFRNCTPISAMLICMFNSKEFSFGVFLFRIEREKPVLYTVVRFLLNNTVVFLGSVLLG